VIGGGISGLATAHFLTRGNAPPEVTVLEADERLGGKVSTGDLLGVPVDTGPDAVLMRDPAAAALLPELGLDGLLRAPRPSGSYLWSRGRLRSMPAGSVFGVPERPWTALFSGLLSPLGFLRAGADLVLPGRRLGPDPTVEELLRPRLGRQVYERLIEPMLGGVHAGRAGRLAARSCVPEVVAMLAGHRSVYLALRGRRAAAGPALMTLDGGLGQLIEALRGSAGAAGARIETGAAVTSIEPAGHRWRVCVAGRAARTVDTVVLATPAFQTARLLAGPAPAAAAACGEIPYAGVATITLAYREDAVGRALDGTGFLVPPVEGRLLVGCTWLSAKWPHLSTGPAAGPAVLLRAMVGRDGDQAWAELDDADLVSAVRAELADAMGVRGEPAAVLVRRLPQAMPQYVVGHSDRLARIDRALADLPGVVVTGAAYRGVGLAGCIRQASRTARDLLTATPEGAMT
jgi:oxygen-dependent protoporphyrinogen oxidase